MALEHLDTTFAALADPTRRAILARLVSGEASVNDLAKPFDMSQPAISKHLKVLEKAGLIRKRRQAQRRLCSVRLEPLMEALGWIRDYRNAWEANFSRLDSLLQEINAGDAKTGDPGAAGPASPGGRSR